MVHFAAKYSLLAIAAVSYVTAQDSGEGFIFKCDKPGDFALTFDDGPSSYTGTLLATLKEYNIKATFFSVGTQAADSSISKYLKQAYEEGHQIASHTNTHADLNKLSVAQIKKEMKTAEEAIRNATGVIPAVMRPPYGNCNDQCCGVMNDMGYTVVQWNVDSNDWKYMDQEDKWDTLITNIGDVVEASDSQTDSFISLQHDIHQFSVARTPKVIDIIKAKGYNFVTVSECLSNRFPMYQNVANPSSSSSSVPTSAVASSSTNLVSSNTASSSGAVSTPSQSSSNSVEPNMHTSSSTSQLPKVSNESFDSSAFITSPTFVMSLITLYMGYYHKY